VVIATAGSAIARRRPAEAGFIVAATVGAAALTAAVNGRARPVGVDRVNVTGAAFPSVHAVQATVCYGALAVIATRRGR